MTGFQVMDNGNLIFPPFQASDYKQEVHAQTYRCIANNELGKIQSRDVHVRAGRRFFLLKDHFDKEFHFLSSSACR